MNKRKLFSLLLCTSVFSSMLLLTACGEKEQQKAPVINPVDITISIDYPDQAEQEDIENAEFTLEEDSSVLEAIQLYCNINDMPVTIEATGGTVVGINNIMNGDISPNRVWHYEINGVRKDTSARNIILKDGDSLKWKYEKESLKDSKTE